MGTMLKEMRIAQLSSYNERTLVIIFVRAHVPLGVCVQLRA